MAKYTSTSSKCTFDICMFKLNVWNVIPLSQGWLRKNFSLIFGFNLPNFMTIGGCPLKILTFMQKFPKNVPKVQVKKGFKGNLDICMFRLKLKRHPSVPRLIKKNFLCPLKNLTFVQKLVSYWWLILVFCHNVDCTSLYTACCWPKKSKVLRRSTDYNPQKIGGVYV